MTSAGRVLSCRDPYCPTHCSPGHRHSQCGCDCDHARVAGRVSSPRLLLEQARRNGEWSWFCEREGCHWSGHGWMTETGARREGERHECRAA